MRKLTDALLSIFERAGDAVDDWDEYEVVEVDKSGKVKPVEPTKKVQGRPKNLKKPSTFNIVTDEFGEGSY